MHSKPLTMIDIAKIAGVSYQTISNVINQPQKVRPETKKKSIKLLKSSITNLLRPRSTWGKKNHRILIIPHDPSV